MIKTLYIVQKLNEIKIDDNRMEQIDGMYRWEGGWKEWIKKGVGERGLMGLGDCGAPSDSRLAHSTIVRYHPPGTTKIKH